MPSTVYELLKDTDDRDIISYLCCKFPRFSLENTIKAIAALRSLKPAVNEYCIADMIIICDDSSTYGPEYFNEIVAYVRNETPVHGYDITNADWSIVLGMTVSESSLQELLPYEIIGDIIKVIASCNLSSPGSPEISRFTQDNFTISRESLYKALGIADDRTDEEKHSDAVTSCHTYDSMLHTLENYAKAN